MAEEVEADRPSDMSKVTQLAVVTGESQFANFRIEFLMRRLEDSARDSEVLVNPFEEFGLSIEGGRK